MTRRRIAIVHRGTGACGRGGRGEGEGDSGRAARAPGTVAG